jgi:hypothetical protein
VQRILKYEIDLLADNAERVIRISSHASGSPAMAVITPGVVTLWIDEEIDEADSDKTDIRFRVVATGQPWDDDVWDWVETARNLETGLVWHLLQEM